VQQLLTSTGTSFDNNVTPFLDATYNSGSASLRWASINSNIFNIYASSGDAQPSTQLSTDELAFGSGASNALDTTLARGFAGDIAIQAIPNGAETQLTLTPTSGTPVSPGSFATQLNFYGDNGLGEYMIFLADRQSFFGFDVIPGSGSTLPILFLMNGVSVFRLNPTGVGNSQGYQSIIAGALTNPSTSTTFNLSVAEPDTTYAVVCTPNFSNATPLYVTAKSMTQFTVNYAAIAVGTDTVDCIITHQ
jgi:hypothetical protein